MEEFDIPNLEKLETVSLSTLNKERKRKKISKEPATFSPNIYKANKELYLQYLKEGKLDQYKGKWISFSSDFIKEYDSREFAVVKAPLNAYVNRVGYEAEEQRSMKQFVKAACTLGQKLET